MLSCFDEIFRERGILSLTIVLNATEIAAASHIALFADDLYDLNEALQKAETNAVLYASTQLAYFMIRLGTLILLYGIMR